jgi:hypothetical protein
MPSRQETRGKQGIENGSALDCHFAAEVASQGWTEFRVRFPITKAA